MALQETRHLMTGENSREETKKAFEMSVVDAFSPEAAAQYAEKMFRLRCEGWGDEARALKDIAKKCGMSPRSVKRLIKRETKDVGLSAFGKIRAAYLAYCNTLIREIQHDLAIDRERYGDAPFESFDAEIQALAEKVRRAQVKKAAAK